MLINFEYPRLVDNLDSALLDQVYELSRVQSSHGLTFFLDDTYATKFSLSILMSFNI